LDQLVKLADSDPKHSETQALAAYEAWVQGKDATALRLARRADELEFTPLPILLVLVATAASDADDRATYEYAKRAAAAPRHDRVTHSLSRLVAGTGLTSTKSRAEELEHAQAIQTDFDAWVAWSRDFVVAYESRGDA
jgi:hypothetical protein